MSKPLWLMMGTAFVFHSDIGSVTPDAASQSFHTSSAGRIFLLTAKHTFAPWDFTKDAKQLKIPEEYRKVRYVVGQLYLPDEEGRAVRSSAMPLRVVSQHPSLDVALLSLNTSTPSFSSIAAPVGLKTDAAVGAGSSALVEGYRGDGVLGEMDTMDACLLEKLSPPEREALLRELQDVEGKQVRASAKVVVLDARGMCQVVDQQTRCYHGMSGGPLLTGDGRCVGVLYGEHPDFPKYIGYTPTPDFVPWLVDAMHRSRGALSESKAV